MGLERSREHPAWIMRVLAARAKDLGAHWLRLLFCLIPILMAISGIVIPEHWFMCSTLPRGHVLSAETSQEIYVFARPLDNRS
jgi:hypothetical protein